MTSFPTSSSRTTCVPCAPSIVSEDPPLTRASRGKQEHLDPSLQGADEPTLAEYEEELRLYEDELQKEHELACAELFVKARHAKAVEQAELVGYLKPPGQSGAARLSSDRSSCSEPPPGDEHSS